MTDLAMLLLVGVGYLYWRSSRKPIAAASPATSPAPPAVDDDDAATYATTVTNVTSETKPVPTDPNILAQRALTATLTPAQLEQHRETHTAAAVQASITAAVAAVKALPAPAPAPAPKPVSTAPVIWSNTYVTPDAYAAAVARMAAEDAARAARTT